MADYRVRIHHNNMTVVGRGWSVTKAMGVAVGRYEVYDETQKRVVLDMAKKARAARQGLAGLIKMRIDHGRSYVEIERC